MRVLPVAALLLLAACQREKSFDERYADSLHVIRASGQAIDAEMQTRASEAAEAEAIVR